MKERKKIKVSNCVEWKGNGLPWTDSKIKAQLCENS